MIIWKRFLAVMFVLIITKQHNNYMKVINPAHTYELANFENKEQEGQILKFIEKTPVALGHIEMQTIQDGTTTEEVLEVAIHRLECLQKLFPCKENACAITHLQEALMWLNERTRKRQQRGVEGKYMA